MSTSDGLHVVLGASGGVGSEALRLLADAGHEVRAVSRTGSGPELPGVTWVAADASTAEGARTAVRGAAVVLSFAQPAYHRWPQEFPGLMTCIADACTEAGAALVMMDNLYCHGPHDGPISESTPMAATTRKGQTRTRIARDLLARHERGELRVTLGRASDYYGARGDSLANSLVLDAVRKGKPGRWVGRLDQPHTHAYSVDVARALIVLAHDDRAYGRPWNLPAAQPLTGEQFVRLAHEVGGVSAEPKLISPFMNAVGGVFIKAAREGKEMMYEFTRPFVVDHSAFDTTFGPFTVTPHREALAASLGRPVRQAA